MVDVWIQPFIHFSERLRPVHRTLEVNEKKKKKKKYAIYISGQGNLDTKGPLLREFMEQIRQFWTGKESGLT